MTFAFQHHHGAMLLKYSGISFISGAVNHGFFISVLALALSSSYAWRRSTSAYVLAVGALVSAGSYGAWQWLVHHPELAATADGHGHSHGEAAQPSAETGLSAWAITRSVEVRMDDQMRFTPNRVDVQAGETIRFVLHNDGQVTHEMVLGDEAQIKAHALEMQQGAGHGDGHSHGAGAAISVPAGQRGELVVKFDKARTLQMACLVPGHYEAGMRGMVNVQTAPVHQHTPQPSAAKPAAQHDHSHHKH